MNNKLTRWIEVRFQREGIHCYPAAATDPELATGDWDDVSFLANPHRHMFHFRVRITVTHNDRDIEFIQFKRWLERLYGTGTLTLDHRSCEMIAEDVISAVRGRFGLQRDIEVEVSEDGENGAVLQSRGDE